MKAYTVEQVATLLKTTDETVRRWIRDNKLEATKASRKEGYIIFEDDLLKFLNSNPKYKNVIKAKGVGSIIGPVCGPIGSIAMGMAGVIGNAFFGNNNGEKSKKTVDEIVDDLKEKIKILNEKLEQNETAINALYRENAYLKGEKARYEHFLETYDVGSQKKSKFSV